MGQGLAVPPGKRPRGDFLGLSESGLTAATKWRPHRGRAGVGSSLPPKPTVPLYCTVSFCREDIDRAAPVSAAQVMLGVQVCSWAQGY